MIRVSVPMQCPRSFGGEVPKIAIMLTEGGGFASHVTRKQAQGARNKDNIQILGIGECMGQLQDDSSPKCDPLCKPSNL